MTRSLEETELVAMADLDPAHLDVAREHFPGIALYGSGREMAERADIEAVFVATGDRFHAVCAREALAAGKHTLIEKPLAQSFPDLLGIAGLQKSSGLTVGTFLELRHSPLWERVMEIVRSGEIGKVLAGSLVEHVGRDRGQFFGRARTRSREAVVSLVLQKGVARARLAELAHGLLTPKGARLRGPAAFRGQRARGQALSRLRHTRDVPSLPRTGRPAVNTPHRTGPGR
jgi:predicted dehydrogenase